MLGMSKEMGATSVGVTSPSEKSQGRGQSSKSGDECPGRTEPPIVSKFEGLRALQSPSPLGQLLQCGGTTWGSHLGLAAAQAATAASAATLYPDQASLLLQDAATHHLGQLLCMGPRVGRDLRPGAWQTPQGVL